MIREQAAVKERTVSGSRPGGGSSGGRTSTTCRPSGSRRINTGSTGAPACADITANPGVVEAGRPRKSMNTPCPAGRFWSIMKPTSSFRRRARTLAR